jgi:hypothetical protein
MARAISGVLAAVVCAGACAAAAAHAANRVQLVPQFVPGETLRYQLDLRSTIRSRSRGPVKNPEAATRLDLSVSAIVRLEVLGAGAAASPGAAARLRATYETVDATAHSDAFDPATRTLLEQYGRLKGRSIEFTLERDGAITGVKGLEAILPDQQARTAMEESLGRLVLSGSMPRGGVAIGRKWSSEQPMTAVPLRGLVRRVDSTYLRNEPCQPRSLAAQAGAALPAAKETCAVIRTRSETLRRNAPRDQTPPEFLARGLRTSGRWSAAGESLSYVSLQTGWVVSVTATGMESMDLVIRTAVGASQVQYVGEFETQSQISLLSRKLPQP